MISDHVKALRPQQWYKNLVVFLGIIFSGNLFNSSLYPTVLAAFTSMCLVSSAGYLLNDLKDYEEDKKDKHKSNRPIASGKVRKPTAWLMAAALLAAGLYLATKVNWEFTAAAVALFALSLAYTLYLKKVMLVDLVTIATNFVIRAVAGALAIGVTISSWLVIGTFLVALYLGLAKRRTESETTSSKSKLEAYTPELTTQLVTLTASALFMSYLLYLASLDKGLLPFATVPPATIALFRHLSISLKSKEVSLKAHHALTDPFFLTAAVAWLALVVVALYA